MTENDYIAEYVKERCPEVLETIDYSVWRFGKALQEMAKAWVDSVKAIDWGKVDWSKVSIDEKENTDD